MRIASRLDCCVVLTLVVWCLRSANVSGTNVYAVLRAPRATGVEAMVFAVDLHQREAMAMMMAYAAFARQQIYWARDLFFVFVDGGAPGMDAWLSAYHLVRHSALHAEPLPEMGGVIIGGVAMKVWNLINHFKLLVSVRISEHALMPGLVVERFDKDGLAAEYLQGLREHKHDKQNYICEMMKQAGLLCHTQHWWSGVKITNVSGTNVYAVLRAPRATGVEAMVFAVDLHQREAMAMIDGVRGNKFIGHAIYFLYLSMVVRQVWMPGYQRITWCGIAPFMLNLFPKWAVSSLESQTGKAPPFVRLEVNHLNGQLPNLDLFNSVVRIAGSGKFGIHSIIYDVRDQELGGTDWHMLVPLRAMYTQAFVAVEGLHSVMGKYGVQAITVAVPALNSYSLRKSTRLLEAIARALNNVLERFHQSYFLYILASPDNFVSIAYFMPIIGGVLLPLLIFAYRDWTKSLQIVVPRSLFVMHGIGLLTWCLCSTYFTDFTSNPRADVLYLGISMLDPLRAHLHSE
ncbi:hypothetical protein COOONC_10625 [Cooperia oncophora]